MMTLFLSGTFVGHSSDGRTLKLAWTGSGPLFGVITYDVQGTIIDPDG